MLVTLNLSFKVFMFLLNSHVKRHKDTFTETLFVMFWHCFACIYGKTQYQLFRFSA